MDTSLSIIIRAFNEEKHIRRLLDGIQQQTIHDLEVILVDSGSSDQTVSIAATYGVKVVHIRPEEFTFGRSLNLGIRSASNSLIVLASAHVYPIYPDWLEKLVAPLSDPQVALSYGKQRGGESSKFSEDQVFAHWYPNVSQPRQSHPFCNNANLALRRSLWEQHLYDENLPGLEDLEWANWAVQQGYVISYVAEAEICHVHHETPRGVYNRYRREGMAFKRIFPHEHFHLADFLRLYPSNLVSDAWHAWKQGILWISLGSILWFRFMQFWGTYQGYRQSGPLTWQLRQTFYYPRGFAGFTNETPRSVKPIQYNR